MVSVEIKQFGHQVGIKALVLAVVLALLTLVGRSLPLFLGLVAGAAVDIGTFHLLSRFTHRVYANRTNAVSVLAMVGVFTLRLVLQMLVLYLALAFPHILNFWTALVGVLIIQVTIFIQAIAQFRVEVARGSVARRE